MRPKVRRLLFFAPFAILGMLLFIAIGGGIVMYLWNWLLPSLFGWHQVTFWQALGLLALCRILFGGLGYRGSGGYYRRRRWQQMTPEERETFRQRMHERWGCDPYSAESQEP